MKCINFEVAIQVSFATMAQYTLYYFQWSLFSTVARYTIALRGEPSSPALAMNIEEKVIDLYKAENISEWYLVNINPKGQVQPKMLPYGGGANQN